MFRSLPKLPPAGFKADDSQMLRFFCRFYDDAVLSHSKYATLVSMIAPLTWE